MGSGLMKDGGGGVLLVKLNSPNYSSFWATVYLALDAFVQMSLYSERIFPLSNVCQAFFVQPTPGCLIISTPSNILHLPLLQVPAHLWDQWNSSNQTQPFPDTFVRVAAHLLLQVTEDLGMAGNLTKV